MDDAYLQVDGAEPVDRVGQVPALADERFEWSALPTRSGVIHDLKAHIVVAKFQPHNRYRPELGTFLHEIQGGRMFLSGIGEGDDQIAQVIVIVQHLAQHVGAGFAAGEADNSRPVDFIGCHGFVSHGWRDWVKWGICVLPGMEPEGAYRFELDG